MRRANVGPWLVVLSLMTGIFPFAASSAPPATVVVGTGNPNIDVPAVQAAVDQGGEIVLKGYFSFDIPPTVVTALAGYPSATVRVSKVVAISGPPGGDDGMTTINGGTIPFYVEAPGAAVTIRGLRFVRPVDLGRRGSERPADYGPYPYRRAGRGAQTLRRDARWCHGRREIRHTARRG